MQASPALHRAITGKEPRIVEKKKTEIAMSSIEGSFYNDETGRDKQKTENDPDAINEEPANKEEPANNGEPANIEVNKEEEEAKAGLE